MRGGWTLRRGAGGGQRVSAASGMGDLGIAEVQMRAWAQAPLFRLTAAEDVLDQALAGAGYALHDPVVLYAAQVADMVGTQTHAAAAYTCTFRPAIMEEIWAAGGIGAGRLAVMDRVAVPKAFLMSRADDTPAGVAFAAVDGEVAMIHAAEVLSTLRRQGAGILLMEAAARFAAEHGATWLALAVTEGNTAARALYDRLGMSIAGRYHYRRVPEETS